MADLQALASSVDNARKSMLEDETRERDRRSGLTALRPIIGQFESEVLPALRGAAEALAPAGLKLIISTGWDDSEPTKRAEVALTAVPVGRWPQAANHVRSDVVTIAGDGERFTVSVTPADPEAHRTAIDCEPGDASAAALGAVVESFLAATTRGPKMRGVELRRSGS